MLKIFTKWTISVGCIRYTSELCKKYEVGGSQVKYDFVLLLSANFLLLIAFLRKRC